VLHRGLIFLCAAGALGDGHLAGYRRLSRSLELHGIGQPGTVMIVDAGFSFDWALVQHEVAKFGTVCTYDVSGTAWSHAGPDLTERVNGVHKLLRAAPVRTPVLVACRSARASRACMRPSILQRSRAW
jgi:hypothetical protein